ncbi:hypothetical protein MHOL44478_06955 [Mycobacterium holsaticum DSM 44478]|nr:hypothetical protein [Mycolicibacterium holsaticum DSM 44478 = JCM 12374]
MCTGTIVTASFTEILEDVLAAAGLNSADPHDVMTWVERTYGHPGDLRRAGHPREIASATAYLASHRNGYVTGSPVSIDGGSDFI